MEKAMEVKASCDGQNAVSRLQVFQAFTNAEDFVYSLWPIVHTMKTREELIIDGGKVK